MKTASIWKKRNYIDWTNDRVLLAELNKRSNDYKRGTVKGISWQDAKRQILGSSTNGINKAQ